MFTYIGERFPITSVNSLKKFISTFAEVKSRFDESPSANKGLVCKHGPYLNSLVLKLQKPSWTNDRMDRVQIKNESGIFFSVWIDEEFARRNRAHYNIHALKLRQRSGYSITSRDFAEEFRRGFASLQDGWPNVALKYGPLTLMQGWIETTSDCMRKDVLLLMERFEQVVPLIDQLLDSRRR